MANMTIDDFPAVTDEQESDEVLLWRSATKKQTRANFLQTALRKGKTIIIPPTAGGSVDIKSTSGDTAMFDASRRSPIRILLNDETEDDKTAIYVELIQTEHSGTILCTGIHVNVYTEPDNGGDASGILVTQTGGGNALTVFRLNVLRPEGFTDYSDSIHGAAEFQTDGQAYCILAVSGSQHSHAMDHGNRSACMHAFIDNSVSDGIVIGPSDLDFDSRLAWVVGSLALNSAPTNQKAWVKLDGSAFFSSEVHVATAATSHIYLTGATGSIRCYNDVNDGSPFTILMRKSRAGGACQANEILGDLSWLMVNSTPAESEASRIRTLATSVTAGAESADLQVHLKSSGTMAERWRLTSGGNVQAFTPTGGQWIHGQLSEQITLSTGGTTTDSAANLLPADAVIEAVVARVTTTIATATSWKLGDATTSGRFSAASSSLTAGSTLVGTVHVDQTGAAGPRQSAAAKLRITTVGTPSAGVVRVTVFYRQFVAPTS
jgi:hypothetical protein